MSSKIFAKRDNLFSLLNKTETETFVANEKVSMKSLTSFDTLLQKADGIKKY